MIPIGRGLKGLPIGDQSLRRLELPRAPVIFTTGSLVQEPAPGRASRPSEDRGNETVAAMAPGPQGAVVRPKNSSEFFDTDLTLYLALALALAGCASMVLAEKPWFDRSEASHAVSLCDMHAKYAAVSKVTEARSYFDTIPPGRFDMPKECPAA